MKHVAKLFIIPLLAFFSCSGQGDEPWELNEPPKNPETYPVSLSFSKASIETFAAHGITEIGIYTYLKDSLVFGENLPLNDGNLKVDLPLGENLQTFAVANADQVIDADSLSKVTIRQDPGMQKQIYISNIVDFTSDKSVSRVNLELKRLVGQAIFQPNETEEEINAITLFDRLNITFTNAGVAYKVKTGQCVQEDVTVTVDRTTGFSASIYSLPTISGDSRTAVDVVYLKDNVEINRTNSPLDTAIAFETSKRSVVYMPILDDAYLTNSWTRTRAVTGKKKLTQPFTVEESEF